MRCPECGNYLDFSFMDDLRRLPVYRCSTIGVPFERGGKVVGHTLDHQDRYYMAGRRVEADRVGNAWTVKGEGLEDLAGARREEWARRDREGVLLAAQIMLAARLRQFFLTDPVALMRSAFGIKDVENAADG